MPDVLMGVLAALEHFAETVTASFALEIPGQAEDQLKAPVGSLAASLGTVLGVAVATKTESHVVGLGGRPDLGVAVGGLLAGHIELKAPGLGARPWKFKGENKKQWEKFQALPNLIYTDGNEWSLFRTGELVGDVVRFPGDVTADGHEAVTDATSAAFDVLMRDFLGWQPIVPSSPRVLAEMIAPLCRLLRTDVLASVQTERSAMATLAGEWRTFLFPHADDLQFADAYAQTLTYAMLLARFEGVTDLRSKAADALDAGHGLLAQVLRVLGQPQARAEIDISVSLLERVIAAVDPVAVAKRGDPWLYFYEDFLAAYDEKLRKNRGVYYTPAQVVGAQVRLVTELLNGAFAKPLGMADDGVTVLDPAVGTGTYPLAALQHSLALVADKYGPGAVAGRATKAAENLHGFELLVGPYSVAHLRLSEQVLSVGGTLPDDGVHVYLTDTLEAPDEPEGQLTLDLLHERLAEENKRARHVKAHTRVMVCLGNPPYYRQAVDPTETGVERQGGWVRHGDHGNDGILNDFLSPVKAAGMGGHAKNLYNLYVYFWRWALWKVFDSTSGPGIVSFITASSYLRGPGFIGMREYMRRTFDELWILDLEGDNLGARKTENVFAIQNPVAIAVGVRYGNPQPDNPATVRYARFTGTREGKLAALAAVDRFADIEWQECFDGWHAPLLPEQAGDYFAWPALTDLFPWQHAGMQWKRTWPIGVDATMLRQRWSTLAKAPASQRPGLFREAPSRLVTRQYRPVVGMDPADAPDPLPPLNGTSAEGCPDPIRFSYRTLDPQWALPDSRLADRPRPHLWAAHSDRQVYLTSLLTGVLGQGPAATVAAHVPDLHHFRGSYGGKDVIPLWRDRDATVANVTAGVLHIVSSRVGTPVTAPELFAYAYAVMSAPGYVDRFSEELTIPGPRVPITSDPNVFARAVRLGNWLVTLHTYGHRSLLGRPPGDVPAGQAKCVVAVPGDRDGYPDSIGYEPSTQVLAVGGTGKFAPVPLQVWDYSVSGFHPVKSWIAFRLKSGAGRKSSDLDSIRPTVWTAEMTEELLRLLWIVEHTLAEQTELDRLLGDILDGDIIQAAYLPAPTVDQRRPPATSYAEQDDGQATLLV